MKCKLRAAQVSQVVVGDDPKSAEKVDLLTIFHPRHLQKSDTQACLHVSPPVYLTYINSLAEHLHILLAAEKGPGLPLAR